MSTKNEDMREIVRVHKKHTGNTAVEMRDVVTWAVARGLWTLPKPVDLVEVAARAFAAAQREEVRHDQVTGKPYRANVAVPVTRDGQVCFQFVDIDEATRPQMVKNAHHRREQAVGEMVQLTLDTMHWNRVHSNEESIDVPADLGPDIEWALNAPDNDGKAA